MVDQKRDNRLRSLINAASDIAGGASGSAVGVAVGAFVAGPIGAVAGGGIGAGATMAIKRVGLEVSSRLLSPREEARIGYVYTLAASEIIERRKNGETVRNDGFFDAEAETRSEAEEVWEAVLLKSQREPEEKKLPYVAHLLANLAFNSEISGAMAHQMTKAAESMTYRQLCILHMSAAKERFNLRNRSYEGRDSFSKALYQLLYEYYDLHNKGLINFGGTIAVTLIDVNPGAATPQALGVDMYYQMRLYLIPDCDLSSIATELR